MKGRVRIQYRWLAPIYVFPEMKLYGLVVSKTNLYHNVLSPNFNIHVSVSDLCFYIFKYLYIFARMVCLFCCSQVDRLMMVIYTINRSQIHECRIVNKAAQFHFCNVCSGKYCKFLKICIP
jgi:hypothetical protein